VRNSSDLPGNGPRGPQIPQFKFRPPSRGRIILSLVIALVLVLFFSAKSLSSFYVNILWFNSVGRSDVYWTILRNKIELGAIFVAVAALFVWLNVMLADRLAPLTLPNTPEDQAVLRLREATAKHRGLFRAGIAIVIGLMLGLPATGEWRNWMMFMHRQAFSTGDPLFKANVGFYVFRLPFAQFVVSWAFGAVVLVTLVTLGFHVINGSIRPQDRVQRVSAQAKVHLSVLLAAGTLVRAADYWLSRYGLTSSQRGVVRGALYTDVKAQLPAINLMILVSLAVSALLIYNVRQKGWRVPAMAVGLWVVVAIAAGSVYPALVQRFVVQPNVSTRELPYIQRNIDATKVALGINKVNRVTTTFDTISTSDVTADDASLRDVRQLDPTQMKDRFALDKGATSYYTVNDLDVDRYSINGRSQQVMVASREINYAGVPNRTWVSLHLLYTHGCGVIAAPASVATSDGRPSYVDLKVTKPDLYFGDGLAGYSVVNTAQKEQACPDATDTSFSGNGGIKIKGILRKTALAINYGEFNLFGSRLINDNSQLLAVRDVRSRVAKVAPFLSLDSDPYPVVVKGAVKWVVDAFTTTSHYPYAELADTSQLSPNSGLNHEFNYVRNSVKAVVDAYSGEVTLYVTDTKDPIIRMWESAFPKLFTPASKVDPDLAAHFKYPEDLFRVQTNSYGRYQFDDATKFFNLNAAWNVSQAPATEPEGSTSSGASTAVTAAGVDTINPTTTGSLRFSPYYTIFHAPAATTDTGEFAMVRPFVPYSADDSRKELRSIMVVSSDPETYGKFTVYDIQTPLPAGPSTIAAQFESEPSISEIITPLDQRGSRVTFGDLQMVPVGKGLIYVRPLYVLPDGNDAKQVFVRKIMASYNGTSVIGDSLTDVVSQLFPGFNMNLGDRVDDGGASTGSTATTVPKSGGSTNSTTTTVVTGTTPADLLKQAEALFTQADAALAKSPPDFSTYQQKQTQARALLQRALSAIGK